MNVLAQTYDFDVRACVLIDKNDTPVAGFPFIKIKDMLSPRIVCLPFSDYCDPIVSSSEDWKKVSNKIFAEQCPVTFRCLHNDIPVEDSRFKLINRAKWHGLNLNDSLDEVYNRFHSSSKRAIRKAEREGVTVRITDREEDMRTFYEMHLKIRKYKYQLLAQSYSFLQNIWKNFIKNRQGVLMLAEHNREIIGGVLYLKWKNRFYYKFNASVINNRITRPNDLLMWEGIKYAKENGCNFLDLGLSDWDQEGLIRYKRKYATEEKRISFLKFGELNGQYEQDQQIRGLISQLTDLFTRDSVADEVTEKAGNVLYRFFT